jgi:hypothetical protein
VGKYLPTMGRIINEIRTRMNAENADVFSLNLRVNPRSSAFKILCIIRISHPKEI